MSGISNIPSVCVERNSNGGYYQNGKEYCTLKKVEVEEEYWQLRVRGGGKAPSKRELAKVAGVSPNYAQKIIGEIEEYGAVVDVNTLKLERWERRIKGVGSHCLTLQEQCLLLTLRDEDSTRTNSNYCHQLLIFSGKKVSTRFISSFFKK